jgi:hypothetical protein
MPDVLSKDAGIHPARHLAVNLPEKIALGAVLGIATGIVFGERASVLQPIGDAYGAMLQIAVFPYLLSSLMHSLGRLSPVCCSLGADVRCHLGVGVRYSFGPPSLLVDAFRSSRPIELDAVADPFEPIRGVA